ncbi:hypothetical protein TNCV_2964421 [Trichonephila clavipes]|nr:hypothetical protein TNCV_2964421 [Trichonephila clavipes]
MDKSHSITVIQNPNDERLKLERIRHSGHPPKDYLFGSEFEKMEEISHRYIIQCFHLKGLSPTDIKAELNSTLGVSIQVLPLSSGLI